MASDIRVTRVNIAELIDISNAVNEQVCKPIAEAWASRAKAAAAAISVSGDYADSIHVEVDKRTSKNDWAHSRVVADVDYATRVESRHGILGRSAP